MFNPGDIVVLKETQTNIGFWNLSWMGVEEAEKFRITKRKWRAKVIKVTTARDKDGGPVIQFERMDTKAHGKETCSHAFLDYAKGDSE